MNILKDYENYNIDVYKINKKYNNFFGKIDIPINEFNNKENNIKRHKQQNKLCYKEVTVYQHKLKELMIEQNKLYAYIKIPITYIIDGDYLLNIYIKKQISPDTFPIIKDYDSEQIRKIYYNNDIEFHFIKENEIYTFFVSFFNNGKIKDYKEFL